MAVSEQMAFQIVVSREVGVAIRTFMSFGGRRPGVFPPVAGLGKTGRSMGMAGQRPGEGESFVASTFVVAPTVIAFTAMLGMAGIFLFLDCTIIYLAWTGD